jgi:hypothetical protein
MITVISTGFAAPTKARCIESVRVQRGVEIEHVYIEAAEQSPPKTKTENLYDAITKLPPDRIVALVDGDDWLAHDRALASSARFYLEGAMVTYGNFVRSDYASSRGVAAYAPGSSPRLEPFQASHLKTFRAGLFQRIAKADLMFEGDWLPFGICDDVAFMIPMLEMAGEDRARFNPEAVYVYNMASPLARYRDRGVVDMQARIAAHLRTLPKYERIASL